MNALLDESLANEIAHLPEVLQRIVLFGSFVTILIGVIGGAVRTFRKQRRLAQEDAMQGFEELRTAPRALPPPPQLPTELLQRVQAPEPPPSEPIDNCRAEVRVLKALLREEQARTAGALLDLTRRCDALERRCEALQAERDHYAARLSAVERADTDRPPPLPTRRRSD